MVCVKCLVLSYLSCLAIFLYKQFLNFWDLQLVHKLFLLFYSNGFLISAVIGKCSCSTIKIKCFTGMNQALFACYKFILNVRVKFVYSKKIVQLFFMDLITCAYEFGQGVVGLNDLILQMAYSVKESLKFSRMGAPAQYQFT